MSAPIQKPKFVGQLMPTKGPVVSPFVIRDREIIVSPGATLPPVCLITGEVIDLKKARYKLDYLRMNDAAFKPESVLMKGHEATPFSAKAMVRYALCDRAMRRAALMEKVTPVLVILGVIGWLAIYSQLRQNSLPASYKAAIIGGYFGGGFLLLWLLHRKNAISLTASNFDGAKIAIRGIDKKILHRMLLWQQQNSTTTNT